MNISDNEKHLLFSVARKGIEGGPSFFPAESDIAVIRDLPPSSPLLKEGSSFVTIYKEGALRGCIGSMDWKEILVLDVMRNAGSAAYRDPRFPPLQPGELDSINLFISILAPLEVMHVLSLDELLQNLRPGIDGLVLENKAGNRSTFLPSVWEKIPDKKDFVHHLLIKGRFPSSVDFSSLDIHRYTVVELSETN